LRRFAAVLIHSSCSLRRPHHGRRFFFQRPWRKHMKTRPTLRLMLAALFSLLPMLAPAADAPAPKEGVDYEVIPDGKPFAPVKGKVEVAEVFSYACVHCAHFEPILQAWKRKQG